MLRSLFLYFRSYTCIRKLILVLWILYGAYSGTKVPVGTTQIPYTEVSVGTTGLILVLQNLYLYYGDYTCLEVPVGTTEILQNVY